MFAFFYMQVKRIPIYDCAMHCVFVCGLCNNTVNNLDYLVSDVWMMISEEWIGKDVKGSGYGLMWKVGYKHIFHLGSSTCSLLILLAAFPGYSLTFC
jgi:hypothetical protein